jgi:hypothetical protein
VFNVKVSATDATAAVGGAAFTWTVQGRPAVFSASLRQVGDGRPVLSLTVAAGKDAPALRTIALSLPGDLRLARRISALSISSETNQPLAHRTSNGDDKLTVTLRAAASLVRVVLGAGSVIAAGSLVTSVRHGQQAAIGLAVEAVDQSGTRTSLPVAVTPRR